MRINIYAMKDEIFKEAMDDLSSRPLLNVSFLFSFYFLKPNRLKLLFY